MSARSWFFFGSYFTSNVLVLVLNELNLIHFLEVLAVHASPLFSLNHFSYSSSFPFFSSCWNPECSHLKVFSNLIIKISLSPHLYVDSLASYRLSDSYINVIYTFSFGKKTPLVYCKLLHPGKQLLSYDLQYACLPACTCKLHNNDSE